MGEVIQGQFPAAEKEIHETPSQHPATTYSASVVSAPRTDAHRKDLFYGTLVAFGASALITGGMYLFVRHRRQMEAPATKRRRKKGGKRRGKKGLQGMPAGLAFDPIDV